MLKYLTRRACLVLAATGTAFVVVGCGGSSHSAYPANVQTNFLNSCESSGGSSDLCQCTLSYLEKHTSYTQFQADEDQLTNGTDANNLPDLVSARDHC